MQIIVKMELQLKNSKPGAFANSRKSLLFCPNIKRTTDNQVRVSLNSVKATETSRYLEDANKPTMTKSSSHYSIDLQNLYKTGFIKSKEFSQSLKHETLSKRLSG